MFGVSILSTLVILLITVNVAAATQRTTFCNSSRLLSCYNTTVHPDQLPAPRSVLCPHNQSIEGTKTRKF